MRTGRRYPRHVPSALLALLLLVGCASTASGSLPDQTQPSAPSSAPSVTTQPSATTTTPSQAEPADQAWLVYNWYQPGKRTKDLFLVHPDGTDAHPIASDVAGEHKGPAWSPDGAQIAFVNADAETPNGSIWTVRADGTGAALFTDGGGKCPEGIYHPAWFADGTKLAVICYAAGGQDASVAIVDVATKELTPVLTVTWPEFFDNAPSPSPDGTSIATDILHWDPTNTFLDGSLVAVVPSAGGQEHRLTSFDTFMAHPDWSPDGELLVMNSYDLGNIQATKSPSNVYTIKPDGTDIRQITHSSVDGAMRICQPHWTPDGRQIVVAVATGSAPNFAVKDVIPAFVDATGGEPVLVSNTRGAAPDLRPV